MSHRFHWLLRAPLLLALPLLARASQPLLDHPHVSGHRVCATSRRLPAASAAAGAARDAAVVLDDMGAEMSAVPAVQIVGEADAHTTAGNTRGRAAV
jgi:hypothetical protein